MFAYRKVLEGKSDAARVRDAAKAALIGFNFQPTDGSPSPVFLPGRSAGDCL
ncbi:hypothetical protein OKW45_004484 [Paraburkholderia sp. WSM4175]